MSFSTISQPFLENKQSRFWNKPGKKSCKGQHEVNILLDECLPRKLGPLLVGHTVKTAPQMGWAGLENGSLLALAEKNFDIFITVDRKLAQQQALAKFNIAVVVLSCRSNRLEDLKSLVRKLLNSLSSAKKGHPLRITQRLKRNSLL